MVLPKNKRLKSNIKTNLSFLLYKITHCSLTFLSHACDRLMMSMQKITRDLEPTVQVGIGPSASEGAGGFGNEPAGLRVCPSAVTEDERGPAKLE